MLLSPIVRRYCLLCSLINSANRLFKIIFKDKTELVVHFESFKDLAVGLSFWFEI